MSPSDDDDDSSCSSFSGDDGARRLQSQSSVEEENDDDVGSQVTYDGTMDLTETDFLTPGGLNSFSVVALPEKREKLALKDLPKIAQASGTSKKNFKVKIQALNVGIESLRKTAVSENSNARSIHDVASNALKRGAKTLDDVAKKMNRLDDDLERTKAKLSTATERMRNEKSERDAAVSEKKTALTNLASKAKSP